MDRDFRYSEDIPQLAADSFELANRLCDTCTNYHALWPYLRLVRGTNGAEHEAPLRESILAERIASGYRRILIAGAADSGVLALVVRAARGWDVSVTVLDRCATPLELCRRFADRWSLSVAAIRADLIHARAES